MFSHYCHSLYFTTIISFTPCRYRINTQALRLYALFSSFYYHFRVSRLQRFHIFSIIFHMPVILISFFFPLHITAHSHCWFKDVPCKDDMASCTDAAKIYMLLPCCLLLYMLMIHTYSKKMSLTCHADAAELQQRCAMDWILFRFCRWQRAMAIAREFDIIDDF